MPAKYKKSKKFLICYITFFSIFIIAIAFGLRYLWLFLESYESTIPDNIAKNIVDEINNKNYSKLFKDARISLSEFEDEEQFIKFLSDKIGDNTVEYSTAPDSTPSKPSFLISVGNKKITTITLKASGEKNKYNFQNYEIESFSDIIEKNHKVSIVIPDTAKAYINGVLVTESYKSKDTVAIKELQNLPAEVEKPYFISYTVTDLLESPVVTATNYNNEEIPLEYNEKENTYTAVSKAGDEITKEGTEVITKIASLYGRYTSQDAIFSDIKPYLIKGSDLYKAIAAFDNTWYADHNSYEIKNIKTSNYISYGKNLFSCKITYDYYVYINRREYVYPADYDFYIVKMDGNWYLYDAKFN